MTQPQERTPDVSPGTEVTAEDVVAAEQSQSPDQSQQAGPSTDEPIDAEQVDPERASSERAAETPPQPDAEQMESALRERGRALAPADRYAELRRMEPTEEGAGTSLT